MIDFRLQKIVSLVFALQLITKKLKINKQNLPLEIRSKIFIIYYLTKTFGEFNSLNNSVKYDKKKTSMNTVNACL